MKKFNLIIPIDLKPKPSPDEEFAARILAKHFRSDVKFVKRANSTTPDIRVRDIFIEIKSPRSNSKYTIANNLREADAQSKNVAISLLRTKMLAKNAEGRIKQWLKSGPSKIKRIWLITQDGRILTILDRKS